MEGACARGRVLHGVPFSEGMYRWGSGKIVSQRVFGVKIILAVLLWGLGAAGAAQERLCRVPHGQLQGSGLARGGGLQGGR